MELKAIDAIVNNKKKEERKPAKPSYRQLFGGTDPSKKNKKKTKQGNQMSKKLATKSNNSY